MMISKLSAPAAALLLLAGCASVSVYGVVGDENDLYTGSATGYLDRSGSIELKNAKGNVCRGDFKYGYGLRGAGIIGCDDGQTAHIVFNGLSPMSGYGIGTSNTGRHVAFTYGLSREQSGRYLGLGRAGIPPATGSGGGASTAPTPPPRAPGKEGTGSGFFVSRQGHVMTNEHVVRGCARLQVARIAGGTVPASLVAADAANDLAVVKIEAAPPSVAAFRTSGVRQGETAVAYGFPLTGLVTSGGAFTTGTVSALAGLRDDTRFFQLSTPIQGGNSGGPVLDGSGAVIGVATASLVSRRGGDVQNVNFAVKADIARTFLDAQGIRPETSAGGRELPATEIAQRARTFTVRVECKAS
jgi:S1-C subfamily serine protease